MENSTESQDTDDLPEMSKQERLRKLYRLSQDIVDSALGKDKHTKRRLYKLRDRVLKEIKQLEAEKEEARQLYYAEIRKEMKRRGFVPSSASATEES